MEGLTAEILSQATGQGLWSLVSIFLIFYILKHSKEREDKFMNKLDDFTDSLNKLSNCYVEIQTDVEEIKEEISEIKKVN